MRSVVFLTVAIGFALCPPLSGHHAFSAEYDLSKPVTVRGIVSEVEWMNPHAYFYINTKDPVTGRVASYACEIGSPNSLTHLGWTRDSIKVGDQVVVHGFAARDGSNTLNVRTVDLASGRKVSAAPPDDGGPMASEKKK